MELDDSSMISTPPEMEPVMEYSLMLTTLSGVTFEVSLSVAKFDRFEDLEDQVTPRHLCFSGILASLLKQCNPRKLYFQCI